MVGDEVLTFAQLVHQLVDLVITAGKEPEQVPSQLMTEQPQNIWRRFCRW